MSHTVYYGMLAGVLGAVAGSFLNVVVYRLPRGESLVLPGSHCTGCGMSIQPQDNVPLLGWLRLRGHCRSCHGGISPRYPLVEGATALLCAAVVLDQRSASGIALGLVLVLAVVPAALIDLDHHLIPNRITAPAALAAIVAGALLDWSGEGWRLIAGAGAGGFLLLAALCYPRGMGMGDVKLAAVMGLLLGVEVIPAMFVALIAAVVVGLVVIARADPEERRTSGVPFGPFLALGALVAVFVGHALLAGYLHHLA